MANISFSTARTFLASVTEPEITYQSPGAIYERWERRATFQTGSEMIGQFSNFSQDGYIVLRRQDGSVIQSWREDRD